MIWLIAGWVAGFLAGVFVLGLLRAASTPEPEEHLHDWFDCNECLHLMLNGYWERLSDEERARRWERSS